MREAQGSSWEISEGRGWALTVALHLRDTLGLRPEQDIRIPRLEPAVEPDEALTRQISADTAAAWNSWFSRLLSGRFPRGQDPRPQTIAAAPGPAFRRLVEAAFEVGCTWVRERDMEQLREFSQQTRERRILINRIVKSVEQSLGREASPFTLLLTSLPVEGFWAHRSSVGHVLMSKATRNNPEELTRLLDPILRELV